MAGVDEFSVVCRSLWPAAERWAAGCSGLRMRSTMTAIKVVDGTVEIVSEGTIRRSVAPNPATRLAA